MEISQLNPHIRHVGRHCASPLNMEYSICYDCRLFYITSGTGNLKFKGGQKVTLKKHDVAFFPPHTIYKFPPLSDTPFELLVFDFDLTTEHIDIKDSLGTASESTFDYKKLLLCETPPSFKAPMVYNNIHRKYRK